MNKEDTEIFDQVLSEPARKYFKLKGKKGGNKTAEKHGKEHYKAMQKKSVESRRANKTLKEEDQAKCIEMMMEGKTQIQMAKEINMPREYVHKIMRDLSPPTID